MVHAAHRAGDLGHDLRGATLVDDPGVGVEHGEEAGDLGRAGGEAAPARGDGDHFHADARGFLCDERVVFVGGEKVLLDHADADILGAEVGHPLHVGADVARHVGIHVRVKIVCADGGLGAVDGTRCGLLGGGSERGKGRGGGEGVLKEGAAVHFFPLPLFFSVPPGVSGKSELSVREEVSRAVRRASSCGCCTARFLDSAGSAARS